MVKRSVNTNGRIVAQTKGLSSLNGGIPPDIKVLVWNYFTDNIYDDGLNDVGDLSIIKPQWKAIKNLTDRDFINYMRQCGSAAIFLNCQSDTEIQHWATICSANISPTSLILNGEQDSEMNDW